jgi:hypothetical protein
VSAPEPRRPKQLLKAVRILVAVRVVAGERRQIEWRAGGAAARSADRRSIVLHLFGRSDYRLVAECAGCARCIRMLCGIKYIGAAAGCRGRRWRTALAAGRGLRGGRDCAPPALLLEPIFGVVLHALELHLKLLITVLKLLDGTGDLTQRIFHSIEPNGKVARIGLRHPPGGGGLPT